MARAPFAEKLARAVAMTPPSDEARVVALFGEWGAGKTTLKYFVAHYLKAQHGITPIEFSPWDWSGRDKLLDAFFVQIGSALRGSRWKWRDFRMARHVRRYAAALGVFTPLAAWGRTWWLPWLMFLFAGASGFLHTIGALLFLSVGVLLLGLQVLTEGIAGYFAKWTELRRDSLDRVRDDLKAVLRDQPQPVVVFVDDLITVS